MRIVSGLKYLFSVVTVRLAISIYYAMQPRWIPWDKAVLSVLLFMYSMLIVDILENIKMSISGIAYVATLAQMSRWLFCYVIGQFIVQGVESVGDRWGLSILETAALFSGMVLVLCALCVPVALTFGLLWCDCGQKDCVVCGLCRDKLRKARENKM
jgi:hypothetical protein